MALVGVGDGGEHEPRAVESQRGPDLVSAGETGYVARSASPEDLAGAIGRVHAEGQALRDRTSAWFRASARRLSIESSLERVLESYAAESARR